MQRPTWLTPWACLKVYGLLQAACMAWLLATHWQAIASPTPQPAQPNMRRAAVTPHPAVAPIPRDAVRHQQSLKREAHQAWGLGAPLATFAAQVHQESRWRANAASPVGAQGMAQFMPATAADMAKRYPAELRPANPHNPRWAFRAQAQYMKSLYDGRGAHGAVDSCERMAFAAASYNGGEGWVIRDRALAKQLGRDSTLFFRGAQSVNAGRSAEAKKENAAYPARILLNIEPRYVRAGFGRGSCN